MVKKERNQEIDIMKGLLTLAMILCHCLQFFGKEDAGIEKILVNVINLTTFSGFLFCFGFVCCLAYFQGDTRRGIVHMLRNMIRLLLAFYISGLAYMAFKEQKIFRKDFIREVLTLRRYPGWSEFLASFAAVLLVGALLLPALRKTNGWVVIGAAVVSLASCFIPYEKITTPWLALFHRFRKLYDFSGIAVRCLLCGGRLGGQTKKMAGLEAVFRSSDLKHPLYLVLLEI
ncbi:MAG: heparan-alpha-glucosaminide N-acetyltransferase domain-containing protein [Lachnospiraceae bacterium]